jgi:hypothetical protein
MKNIISCTRSVDVHNVVRKPENMILSTKTIFPFDITTHVCVITIMRYVQRFDEYFFERAGHYITPSLL